MHTECTTSEKGDWRELMEKAHDINVGESP